jgi:ATP-dependent DNA helicase RecQ
MLSSKVPEVMLLLAMSKMGFDTFRSPEQEQLIRAVANGHDAIGILSTGAGKSACFIVPTIALRLKTVVISPLIALMNDQVAKLRRMGVQAFALNGETPEGEWRAAVAAVASRGAVLLYVSPETLLNPSFRVRFPGFCPDLLAVDEAHCVSTWGETFRPYYLRLREAAKLLGNPQCVALSATIDPRIEADVRKRLPLRKDAVRVAASPFRDNLVVEVRHPGVLEKTIKARNIRAIYELRRIMREDEVGATIVYCYSRDQSAMAYQRSLGLAQRLGYTPILFHAEIPKTDKRLALGLFLNRPRPIVFCTSAFGMGIDRPDVRTVVHFDTPNTLVDYAQQIGRGGRDGELTRCITFYNPDRLDTIESRDLNSIPPIDFVESVHL